MAKSDVNSEDILGSLDLELNQEVFDQVAAEMEKLENKGKSFDEVLQQVAASSQKASEGLTQMATQSVSGIEKTTSSVQSLSTQLTAAAQQADKLSEAMQRPMSLPEQASINQMPWMSGGPNLPEQGFVSGLPQFADTSFNDLRRQMWMEGTFDEMRDQLMSAGGGEEEGGGGGGGTGSLFALGHGLSVAGHSLQSPLLREAGGFVYIEEGIRKTLPMLEEAGISFTTLAGVGLPLIAAVTAIGAEFSQLTQIIEQGRKAVGDALTDQVKYYEYTATHTSADAKERITQEEGVRDANLRAAQNAKNVLVDLIGGKNTKDEIEAALKENKPEMLHFDVTQAPAVLALFDQINKLGEAAGKSQTQIDELTNGIEKGDFAAKDAAEHQATILKNTVDRYDREANLKKQEVSDSQMTSEAAEKRLDTLKQQISADQDHMNALAPLVNTSKEAKDQFDQLRGKINDETKEVHDLENSIIPLIKAREDEKKAIEDVQNNLNDAAKAIDDFGKKKASLEQQLADQTANAKLRESQAEQQYMQGSLQDTYARNEIKLKESRKETDIQQDTADKIVDIRTKLTTNENKIARDFQEQRQDEALSHAQKLADIDRKQTSDQQMALLDRNFLQLAKNEQAKNDQIAQENQHYAEIQAKDQQTLLRKIQDAEIAANVEINQQVVNEARKLAAARQAEQQQLEDLSRGEQQKIAVLRQNLSNELILYGQQEQQRLNIAVQTQNAIVSHAMATIAQIGLQQAGNVVNSVVNTQNPFVNFLGGIGHSVGLFATGGNFGAGQPFLMNEPGAGPETLRFGGRGYNIPGMAMVMPLQGGSVQQGGGRGGNTTYAPNITVYESQHPEETVRLIEQSNTRLMKEFFAS